MRKSARILALAAPLVALLSPVTSGPAHAADYRMPANCEMHGSHWQTDATTLVMRMQLTCNRMVSGMEHHNTYQKDGDVVGVKHKDNCANRAAVIPYSCTIDYVFYDKAGSQHYEVLDEWFIYLGPSYDVRIDGMSLRDFTS